MSQRKPNRNPRHRKQKKIHQTKHKNSGNQQHWQPSGKAQETRSKKPEHAHQHASTPAKISKNSGISETKEDARTNKHNKPKAPSTGKNKRNTAKNRENSENRANKHKKPITGTNKGDQRTTNKSQPPKT